jgi:uncharacterized RDD family membrane protein YckC
MTDTSYQEIDENQDFESTLTNDIVDDRPDLFEKYLFPPLIKRVQAIIIDIVIIITVFFAATYIFNLIGDVPTWIRTFVFVFMLFLYDPLLISLTGGTIGHHMLEIKVCRVSNPEKKISIPDAFFRFIIKSLIGWLSFLTISFNNKKRAIHDFAGSSVVISKGQVKTTCA